MNSRFQNALHRTPQNVPPIWMMRQAGRYHSHYQALRAKHSFADLCLQPELAAQVALGPVQDFDFDVAILFSDILFPLQGLGMGLQYTDAGPRLDRSLNKQTLLQLKSADEGVQFMQFQKQAMQQTRALLPKTKSLIGFVGGLWTLYVYAVEGSHAGGLIQAKADVDLFHQFMRVLAPLLERNIQLQLEGGAEVIMIFDTAAGEVSPQFFKSEIESYLLSLIAKFPRRIGYYSRGTNADFFSPRFLQAPWAGMGVDHRWNLAKAFQLLDHGFVQGNFDQALLFQEFSIFKKTLNEYLQPLRDLSPQQRTGWVCGLGHGVLPKTPQENVKYFVDQVREVLS